jgi:phospholipid/cholesterol/gamma-HCH transport system permease protein
VRKFSCAAQQSVHRVARTFILADYGGSVTPFPLLLSIGTMRVTEQIDALEVMGVNSLNYLFSKIIALLLYPFVIVLVCFRDFRGWMAWCHGGFTQWLHRCPNGFHSLHIFMLLKTLIFAMLLATIPSFMVT